MAVSLNTFTKPILAPLVRNVPMAVNGLKVKLGVSLICVAGVAFRQVYSHFKAYRDYERLLNSMRLSVNFQEHYRSNKRIHFLKGCAWALLGVASIVAIVAVTILPIPKL